MGNNIANSYIDTFYVRNRTNRPVTLGDLVNLTVPANQTIDLLKIPRITKEKINQSQDLMTAVSGRILRIIKQKPTGLSEQVQEAILPDFEDITNVDEVDILSKSVVITSPRTNENIPVWVTEEAITILEIRGVTDLGTVTFNVEYRDLDTAYAYGTEIPSSSIIADTDSQIQAGFANSEIAESKWIALVTSAKSGATQLTVNIKYAQT